MAAYVKQSYSTPPGLEEIVGIWDLGEKFYSNYSNSINVRRFSGS